MTDNRILQALTREGVLINVSVRFWRASKMLEPGDLGFDPALLYERRARYRTSRGSIEAGDRFRGACWAWHLAQARVVSVAHESRGQS